MKNLISIGILSLLLFCQQNSTVLTFLYSFPDKLDEVSGISYSAESGLLWVLEDSGNKEVIYGLDSKGEIQRELKIKGIENVDWEDITKDSKGNLYIGDFGNNNNKRKDLCIYKIAKKALNKKKSKPAYKVAFTYPEQKKFPPKRKKLFYDAEGFFEFKGNFYLFTKNHSLEFEGTTLLYKIPNKAGTHEAKLLGKFKTGKNFATDAVTGAAINPEGSKVALLTHNKIWLFEKYEEDNFFSGEVSEVDLEHYSQKEAICFKGNNTILIADERVKKTGGFVYEVNLKKK